MTDMTEIEKAIDEFEKAVDAYSFEKVMTYREDIREMARLDVQSKRARLLELIKEVKHE